MRSKYLFWFLGTLSFCEKVQMSNFKAWFDVERIDDVSFNGMFLYQFNLDLGIKFFVKPKNIFKKYLQFLQVDGVRLVVRAREYWQHNHPGELPSPLPNIQGDPWLLKTCPLIIASLSVCRCTRWWPTPPTGCTSCAGTWRAGGSPATPSTSPRVTSRSIDPVLELAFKMYCSERTVVLLKWSFRNCESS